MPLGSHHANPPLAHSVDHMETILSKRNVSKRSKVTRACDRCKSKKKRCTGDLPCRTCRRIRASCTYDAIYSRGIAGPPSPSASVLTHNNSSTPAELCRPSEDGMEETPEDDVSVAESSETTTGVATSHKGVDASTHQSEQISSSIVDTVDGQYHGPTSAHFFLGRAWRPLDQATPSASLPFDHDSGASIFAFGDRVLPRNGSSSLVWPSPITTRELLQRYFEYASPTYHFLHKATTASWIHQMDQERQHDFQEPLSTATKAVVFLVLAIASMFRIDSEGNAQDADEEGWRDSELYYAEAQRLLSHETGPPSVESIQARFLTVLWLLSTSRMNKAWFTHGTTVQLIYALGLHRTHTKAHSSPLAVPGPGAIKHECRKRTLWCAYTLDNYISLILGRPRLLRLEDIDQDLPAHVNDDDLMIDGIHRASGKDCTMTAPIVSALLAQILARSFRDQYAVRGISDRQQMEASLARTEEIAAWHATLPPFLSGAVHPSSLIPSFRRQCSVIRLAHAHTVMFVTRPLLLRNYSRVLPDHDATYRSQITRCIVAARDAIDIVMGSVLETPLFPAFWHSQYAVFNALSIIYIFIIQTRKRRIPQDLISPGTISRLHYPTSMPDIDEHGLFKLAEQSQQNLAKAAAKNSPAWRYSVILEGLRNEVGRLMERRLSFTPLHPSPHIQLESPVMMGERVERPRNSHGMSLDNVEDSSSRRRPMETGYSSHGYNMTGLEMQAGSTCASNDATDSREDFGIGAGGTLLEIGMSDLDFSLDFWPQLDSLPLSSLGHGDETDYH